MLAEVDIGRSCVVAQMDKLAVYWLDMIFLLEVVHICIVDVEVRLTILLVLMLLLNELRLIVGVSRRAPSGPTSHCYGVCLCVLFFCKVLVVKVSF